MRIEELKDALKDGVTIQTTLLVDDFTESQMRALLLGLIEYIEVTVSPDGLRFYSDFHRHDDDSRTVPWADVFAIQIGEAKYGDAPEEREQIAQALRHYADLIEGTK